MPIIEISGITTTPIGIDLIQNNSNILPIQRPVIISPEKKPIIGAQNIGR
jgi:hypothetical protein